ncbi:Uma2 family endonuclease [Candidatus Amarolinea dominans]|uniref:Uma2 family endonuclease n=1 Tax=Candidatus Amarolinea dominans TaxID=3140696 RepID=UPI001DC67620|nr:Uma2 family endonuclease [Anaerolineae bacterium]
MTLATQTMTRPRARTRKPQLDSGRGWPRDIGEAFARPPGPYTLDEVAFILEEEPVELLNGWLVRQEMTDLYERRFVSNLGSALDLAAREAGFGQVLGDQTECVLSNGSVVKPDVALISWKRMATAVPMGPLLRPTLIGSPELVVEVRSPSNRRTQEIFKRSFYFANGTRIVWDVDDKKREVWVYRAEQPDRPAHLRTDDMLTCEPLIPGWRRRLGDLFEERVSAKTLAGEVAVKWVAEGKAQGIAEGKAQGIAEGKTQGIAEGESRALRALLPTLARLRFGAEVPADLPATLAALSDEQLLRLQTGVETAATCAEWLAMTLESDSAPRPYSAAG